MISRSFIYKRTLTQSAIYFPYGWLVDVYTRITDGSGLTMVLRAISNLTMNIVKPSVLGNISRESELVTEFSVNSKTSKTITGNSIIRIN